MWLGQDYYIATLTKGALNTQKFGESVEHSKEKISDMRIKVAIKYAYLMSEDIHSLEIDVDVIFRSVNLS